MNMRAIVLGTLLLLATACGGAGDAGGATDTAADTATDTATDAATESPSEPATPETEDAAGASETPTDAAGGEVLTVAESDLGSILADGEGNTVYLFLADEGSESTCYDDCESNWPPLTVADADAAASALGDGVDSSLVATTERTDGTVQVTYNGSPLYYFAGDQAPGDVNGQGVGDVWFAVSPEGEQVSGTASEAAGRDY